MIVRGNDPRGLWKRRERWPGDAGGQEKGPHIAICRHPRRESEGEADGEKMKETEEGEADQRSKGGTKEERTEKREREEDGEGKGGWEKVDLVMDSGATETVIGRGTLGRVDTRKGEDQKKGVTYELANGDRISNLGEKEFKGVTSGGKERGMVAQVVDVTQNRMSVSRCIEEGNRVVFDKEGSYVEDKRSGEVNWLHREGGLWTWRIWVRTEKRREDDRAKEEGIREKGDFQRRGGNP